MWAYTSSVNVLDIAEQLRVINKTLFPKTLEYNYKMYLICERMLQK